MASSIKKDIKELREAGYLAKEIVHRLLAKGQIVPTPEPHERVVFLTHFVHGLGFPSPSICLWTDVLLWAGFS